jgi:hypothetical protein
MSTQTISQTVSAEPQPTLTLADASGQEVRPGIEYLIIFDRSLLSQIEMELRNETKPCGSQVPQWLQELSTRGWTVVPEAIAREKALEYADQAYAWLESWKLGYDRHNESTRKASKLPFSHRAGIFARSETHCRVP